MKEVAIKTGNHNRDGVGSVTSRSLNPQGLIFPPGDLKPGGLRLQQTSEYVIDTGLENVDLVTCLMRGGCKVVVGLVILITAIVHWVDPIRALMRGLLTICTKAGSLYTLVVLTSVALKALSQCISSKEEVSSRSSTSRDRLYDIALTPIIIAVGVPVACATSCACTVLASSIQPLCYLLSATKSALDAISHKIISAWRVIILPAAFVALPSICEPVDVVRTWETVAPPVVMLVLLFLYANMRSANKRFVVRNLCTFHLRTYVYTQVFAHRIPSPCYCVAIYLYAAVLTVYLTVKYMIRCWKAFRWKLELVPGLCYLACTNKWLGFYPSLAVVLEHSTHDVWITGDATLLHMSRNWSSGAIPLSLLRRAGAEHLAGTKCGCLNAGATTVYVQKFKYAATSVSLLVRPLPLGDDHLLVIGFRFDDHRLIPSVSENEYGIVVSLREVDWPKVKSNFLFKFIVSTDVDLTVDYAQNLLDLTFAKTNMSKKQKRIFAADVACRLEEWNYCDKDMVGVRPRTNVSSLADRIFELLQRAKRHETLNALVGCALCKVSYYDECYCDVPALQIPSNNAVWMLGDWQTETTPTGGLVKARETETARLVITDNLCRMPYIIPGESLCLVCTTEAKAKWYGSRGGRIRHSQFEALVGDESTDVSRRFFGSSTRADQIAAYIAQTQALSDVVPDLFNCTQRFTYYGAAHNDFVEDVIKGYCYTKLGYVPVLPLLPAWAVERPSDKGTPCVWAVVGWLDGPTMKHPIIHIIKPGGVSPEVWDEWVSLKALIGAAPFANNQVVEDERARLDHIRLTFFLTTVYYFVMPSTGKAVAVVAIGTVAMVAAHCAVACYTYLAKPAVMEVPYERNRAAGYCWQDLFYHAPDLGRFPSMTRVLHECRSNPYNVKMRCRIDLGFVCHVHPDGEYMIGDLLTAEDTHFWWMCVGGDFTTMITSYVTSWLNLLPHLAGPVHYQAFLNVQAATKLVSAYNPSVVISIIMVSIVILGLFFFATYFARLPAVKVYTFGSRGDKVPLQYYTRLLRSYGFRAEQVDILSDKEGVSGLSLVETNRFLAMTKKLARLPREAGAWLAKDPTHIAFMPQGGLGMTGRIVTYELAPPPSELKSWVIVDPAVPMGRLLNLCFRLAHILGRPDIRIGSFRGCAPRSANGKSLLRLRPNKGKRKCLVAMGSSSVPEPRGLDPTQTWSTRKDSIYQFDPRTDHATIMRDYRRVFCHGGAGTMATAASCSAVPTSCSKLIDRDYVDNPKFWFGTQHHRFWLPLMSHLTHAECALLLVKMAAMSPQDFIVVLPMYITRLFVKSLLVSYVLLAWLSRAQALSLLAMSMPTMLSEVILSGFSTRPSFAVSFLVFTIARVLINCDLAPTWSEALSYIRKGLVDITRLCGSSIWCFVTIMAGPVPALFCFYVHTYFQLAHLPGLLSKSLLWLYYAQLTFKEDPRKIRIRFIPIDATIIRELPFYHTEFYNPSAGLTAGITVREGLNKRIECCYYSNPCERAAAFTLNTGIDISEWESITSSIRLYDGKLYNPVSNCQTVLLSVRSCHPWNFDMMILSASCTTVCLLLGIGGFFCTGLFLALVTFGVSTEFMGGFLPILTAFGGELNITTLYQLFWYILSPSVDLETPMIVGPNNYPDIPIVTTEARSTKSVRVVVAGEETIVAGPAQGIYRSDLTTGRDGSHTMPHGMREDQADGSQRVQKIHKMLDCMTFPTGDIAVLACSKERPPDRQWLSKLANLYDGVVVLTNEKMDLGANVQVAILECNGRELACARACMPPRQDTRWFCFNSTQATNVPIHEILLAATSDPHFQEVGFVSVLWYGLHQASCSAMHYKRRPDPLDWTDPCIYGADELVFTKIPGLLLVHKSKRILEYVYNEMIKTKPRIVQLFDYGATGYRPVVRYSVTTWNASAHLKGLASMETGPFMPIIAVSRGEIWLMGHKVDCGRLASDLYMSSDPLAELRRDLCRSKDALLKRLSLMSECILASAKTTQLPDKVWESLVNIEAALSVLSYGTRPLKNAWALELHPVASRRVEELGLVLHPNPQFIAADYDTTVTHYLSHLNANGPYRMSLHEFVRKVQRNPHIDTHLRNRADDGGVPDGIDGQSIANKELVISSLAKYAMSATVDALLLDDIKSVASSIVNMNPDLYCDLRFAKPAKLVNHFLKHKQYSAGLPFIGKGRPGEPRLKKRSDLKKQKWLMPLAKLAVRPFITGEWYPGLAHAFTKSQVVKFNKLATNPFKLRTIVATSVINNIQQGIMYFDANNRHAPHGCHSKVGITLNGAALGSVFESVKNYKNIYSLDVSDFDRSMEETLFLVEAEIRKIGFENHPARDVINKHIDCAIKQTQYAHIVNLISEEWDTVENESGGESKRLFNAISPELKAEAKACDAALAQRHDSAPGGILTKIHGGATGDSNTTYTNTTGLAIVLVYCVSKVMGWKFDEFFDKCSLSNTGDDNIFATDETIDLDNVFKLAKLKFGLTFRVESSSLGIFGQRFLGKIPVKGSDHKRDFDLIGIDPPTIAVIHDRDMLMMRYHNFKADANRNFKTVSMEREYKLKKGIGFLGLTAHQEDVYNLIRSDLDQIVAEMPRKERKAKLPRIKIPSYKKVVEDWYKPGTLATQGTVQKLNFAVSAVTTSAACLTHVVNSVKAVCEYFPSHLVTIHDENVLERREIETSSGIFEAHAFHAFTRENGRRPTLKELEDCLRVGPYAAFCEPERWYSNIGVLLPDSGEQFEANANYSFVYFWWYTYVYSHTNQMMGMVNHLPLGQFVLDAFHLTVFSSRNLFGTLNYMHYAATGTSSVTLSNLVPKDPYRYHKRFAYSAASRLAPPKILGCLPLSSMSSVLTFVPDVIGWWFTKTIFQSHQTALNGTNDNSNAWVEAAKTALDDVMAGNTVSMSAPTGTGKTRYLPTIFAELLPDRTIVVVLPRRLLCREFSRYPGVTWVRRGKVGTTRILTMTYGYLQHRVMSSTIPADYFFIFDEAHETSCEWIILRERFLKTRASILLTATPLAWMRNYTHIDVKVAPLYEIEEVRCVGRNLDEVVIEATKLHDRILLIEPSKRKAEALALRFADYGFTLLSSDHRTIPLTGHIVATAIVDAGVTIPRCDCVIDIGTRVVNDQGTTRVVPMDTATSIQRRGRTGRVCHGFYYYFTDPINTSYTPSPSVSNVLLDDAAAIYFNVGCTLLKPPQKQVFGDNYVHMVTPLVTEQEKYSMSLFLMLKHNSHTTVDAYNAYRRIIEGGASETEDYLLEAAGVTGRLLQVPELRGLVISHKPHYLNKSGGMSLDLAITKNVLDIKGTPTGYLMSTDKGGS